VELERENARLRAVLAERDLERDGLIVERDAAVAARDWLLGERDGRIAELEWLLAEARRAGKRQASPFSKGDPKPDPKRPGRKAGERHGKHGHRPVPSIWDREEDAPLPGCCPDCGSSDLVEDDVVDQFQTDIPEVKASTTRFRVHRGHCADCGRRLQGRHPEQTSDALGAAAVQIGPHAKAFAAFLHYVLGLSFGRSAKLLEHFGIGVSRAAICRASQSTGTALVPTQKAILATIRASKNVAMDESGWRIGGDRAWLWTATCQTATAYFVGRGRGFEQACELLPADYDGVLVRDGWIVYPGYTQAVHQSCLWHLRTRCRHMIEDLPGWARGTPREVNDLLGEALDARALGSRRRKQAAADITERVDLLIAQAHPHEANQRLIKHLARERTALFTFLERPDVEPASWRAEQAIRPAVVNRKTWGGNRTEPGAVTQSNMMSFFRTAHQQDADPIGILIELARAPTPGVANGLTLLHP
jgi:transposase